MAQADIAQIVPRREAGEVVREVSKSSSRREVPASV